MTIRRRISCWISKATRTQAVAHALVRSHTQKYVILIAFPRQQWLRERASVLRYTYLAWLVSVTISFFF